MTRAFELSEEPLGKPRNVRAIVVGAGVSGIAFTYLAKQHMKNFDFVIYEKNPDVGGTWYEARYPGCACDIPSHSYTYSWVGNPDWTRLYVGRGEIFKFYKGLAEEYKVAEKTKFRHMVVGAKWLTDEDLWEIEIENLDTKERSKDRAEVFFNLGGILNNYKWPEIKGMSSFAGRLVHSANWDDKIELKDKTVVVIGSGSSGIQVVPQIQPIVKKLISINRSPNYISNELASDLATNGRLTAYSEEERERFRNDPEYFLKWRRHVEHVVNKGYLVAVRDSKDQIEAREATVASMKERLKHKPELVDALIPDFELGCRRITPGYGYLEALQAENTEVVTTGITEIKENGIVTQDGRYFDADVIVCCTGYDTSFRPRFPLIGDDGVDLRDRWANGNAAAYFGVTAPHLPNYICIGGPNTPIAQGSLIPGFEKQIEYGFKMVKKLQTQKIRSFVVDEKANQEFNEFKDVLMERTTWSGNCASWYKGGVTGKNVTGPWPGSQVHYLEAIEEPRYEDFSYKYQTANRFQYLGNGWTQRELDQGDLGYYVRDDKHGLTALELNEPPAPPSKA